jgi:hypothetical protein
MCDTYEPLRLTTAAVDLEDKGYHTSWVTAEGDSAWTSK